MKKKIKGGKGKSSKSLIFFSFFWFIIFFNIFFVVFNILLMIKGCNFIIRCIIFFFLFEIKNF